MTAIQGMVFIVPILKVRKENEISLARNTLNR